MQLLPVKSIAGTDAMWNRYYVSKLVRVATDLDLYSSAIPTYHRDLQIAQRDRADSFVMGSEIRQLVDMVLHVTNLLNHPTPNVLYSCLRVPPSHRRELPSSDTAMLWKPLNAYSTGLLMIYLTNLLLHRCHRRTLSRSAGSPRGLWYILSHVSRCPVLT